MLASLIVGVRTFGLVAEDAFPSFNPKLFAAVGYPALALGPPLLVMLLARDRPATRTAILTVVGLGAGIALEFGGIGVTQIPIQLALHRTTLIVALGLFALGVSRGDRWTVGAGSATWALALAAPLAGVV